MFQFLFRTLPLLLFNLLRLFLYVCCLLPGFTRFAWYYFVASDRVVLQYGNESIRQKVDVYRVTSSPLSSCSSTATHLATSGGHLDDNNERESILRDSNNGLMGECSPAPVVLFCTGGGWMIGYKMWGALLARALTAAGIVVVIPDMRNYPLVSIPHMVDDIDAAIGWTIQHIAAYGGDPTNVVVVGQSAGGHVACMAIFRNIQQQLAKESLLAAEAQESFEDEEQNTTLRQLLLEDDSRNNSSWKARDLKGFSIVSSPLSLGSPAMTHSFRRKGFDDNMVHQMFGLEKEQFDPLLQLQNFASTENTKDEFLNELPPISIYQGTNDKTVPYEVSEAFYKELRAMYDNNNEVHSNKVSFTSYVGWTHTDPILERPMDGDQQLHKDLYHDVIQWTNTTLDSTSWPVDSYVNDRLCPHFMVEMGRIVMPF